MVKKYYFLSPSGIISGWTLTHDPDEVIYRR
jgi:hypothetical protein